MISILYIGRVMSEKSQRLGHQRTWMLMIMVQKSFCCTEARITMLASLQSMTTYIDLRSTVIGPCMNGCKWPRGSSGHLGFTRLTSQSHQRMNSVLLNKGH